MGGPLQRNAYIYRDGKWGPLIAGANGELVVGGEVVVTGDQRYFQVTRSETLLTPDSGVLLIEVIPDGGALSYRVDTPFFAAWIETPSPPTSHSLKAFIGSPLDQFVSFSPYTLAEHSVGGGSNPTVVLGETNTNTGQPWTRPVWFTADYPLSFLYEHDGSDVELTFYLELHEYAYPQTISP